MKFTYFADLRKQNYFNSWSKGDLAWLIISTLVILIGVFIGWDSSDTLTNGLISLFGTVTGMWCVVAVTKQRLSNYIFGLINVSAFAYLYFHWGMYGMAALNLFYFVPMQFHGFFNWFKNRKDVDVVNVKWASKKQIAVYLVTTLVATSIMYVLLTFAQEAMSNLGFVTLGSYSAALIFLDAIGVVGNIIAQILMNYRLTDQWIYWLVIDITQTIAFAIFAFVLKDVFAVSMFVMYVCWLINAYFGLRGWMRDSKISNA